MSKILIIGAGAMGSAFSFPCVDNGHTVSIMGSPLENKSMVGIPRIEYLTPVFNSSSMFILATTTSGMSTEICSK